jgi:hypothetical protein
MNNNIWLFIGNAAISGIIIGNNSDNVIKNGKRRRRVMEVRKRYMRNVKGTCEE